MRRKEWGQGFATSIKKCLKGETVADGKAISGKRRLTEKDMDSLQYYEAKAIRENTHSFEAMRKAVWAIYFHKLSTDEDPKRGLCPPGESSWCGYNRSLAARICRTLPTQELSPGSYDDQHQASFLSACSTGASTKVPS